MKHFLFILFVYLFVGASASAQDIVVPAGNEASEELESLEVVDSADIEEIDDSTSIAVEMMPLTLQQKLDSMLTRGHTIKVTRYQKVRQRGRRRARLQRVTTTVTRKPTVGCYIYNLTADTLIYALNEKRRLLPASTQKLFTAAAMLEHRGRRFDFETSISTMAVVRSDSTGRRYLDGDIIIHGNSDPLLSRTDAENLKDAVFELEVDSIAGSILLYDSERYRHQRAYDQQLPSLIARMLMKDSIAFRDPQPWGTTRERINMQQAFVLGKVMTPLEDVLRPMLKRSTNSYAETMLLNLVPDDGNWSYQACRKAVSDTYGKAATHTSSAEQTVVADGSGLSRGNAASAESEVNLLRYIARNRRLFTTIYENLPIGGVDGTLIRRLKKPMVYDNVRAKTGTLNGVQTLAGYLTASSGDRIAFAIMLNDSSDATFGKHLIDEVLEQVVKEVHQ